MGEAMSQCFLPLTQANVEIVGRSQRGVYSLGCRIRHAGDSLPIVKSPIEQVLGEDVGAIDEGHIVHVRDQKNPGFGADLQVPALSFRFPMQPADNLTKSILAILMTEHHVPHPNLSHVPEHCAAALLNIDLGDGGEAAGGLGDAAVLLPASADTRGGLVGTGGDGGDGEGGALGVAGQQQHCQQAKFVHLNIIQLTASLRISNNTLCLDL